MRKIAFIAFISVGVAATNQIVIQPLYRAVSAQRSAHSLKLTASATRAEGEPSLPAPVSGYVADPGGRGIRPIMGFRIYTHIGKVMDFGEDVASVVSSPHQNYVVEVTSAGDGSLWLPVDGGLEQQAFPEDVSFTNK